MPEFNYTKNKDLTALSARFKQFEYKKHAHEEYSIGVTLNGIQQYILDGENCASTAGGVMLFHPEQIHDGCSGDKKGLEYVMLYIPKQVFSEVSCKKDVIKFSAPIVYDKKLAANIINLVRSLEAGTDDLLSTELIMEVTNRSANADEEMRMPKSYNAVRRAIEMMHDSADAPLKLDEICNEVQMSKYHFIRQFKNIKGASPYQYSLNLRTVKAKKLLDAGEELYSVMVKCGFYDLSHMNRQFKGMHGITAFAYSQLQNRS